MSVSKLSVTLQRQILENIIAKSTAEVQAAINAVPPKTFSGITIPRSIDINSATRLLADQTQTGVLSDQAIKDISQGFKNIAQGFSKVGARVLDKNGNISKQPGYKDLKAYLKQYVKNSKNLNELDALQNVVKELALKADKVLSETDILNQFIDFLNIKFPEIKKEIINNNVLELQKLTHAGLNKKFSEFLLYKTSDPVIVQFIDANTDAGHLLGIFNQRLIRTFGASINTDKYDLGEVKAEILKNTEANSKEDYEAINRLNSTFSSALNLAEFIDFLTSSLKSNPDIFIKLSKETYLKSGEQLPVSAAELQLSLDNSEIGRLLLKAGKDLTDLVNTAKNASFITLPGQTTQVRKTDEFTKKLEELFKNLGNLGNVAKTLATSIKTTENNLLDRYLQKILEKSDQFADVLLNAEGSDSVKKAIGKTIAYTVGKNISNIKKPIESKTAVSKTQKSKSKSTVNKTPSTKSVTNLNIAQSRLDTSVARKTRRKPLPPTSSITNLTNLQNLLNARLVQQVKQNMGNSTRRDVLNLQSGRFAESVEVTRLSESRQGMITAFYTYMKNPYATFSAGGRQEFPPSRDPKTLISKSIREIAAEQVSNRLRSVLV